MFYSVICESNLLQYKHLGVYPINRIDRWGLSASDAQTTDSSIAQQLNSDIIDLLGQKIEISSQISTIENQIREEIGYQQKIIISVGIDVGVGVLSVVAGGDISQVAGETLYDIKDDIADVYESKTKTVPFLTVEKVGLESELNTVEEIVDMKKDQLGEIAESAGYLFGQF